MNQTVTLPGKHLFKDGKDCAVIQDQITLLGACDQHQRCAGPVVRLKWANGKVRKECLFVLIKQQGYELKAI